MNRESAARMRRRIRNAALLRSIFWQGENPLQPHGRDGLDPVVLAHVQNDELLQITKREGVELCSTLKGRPFITRLAACAVRSTAPAYTRIRALLKFRPRKTGYSLDASRFTLSI
jgi:hypothetical protein